MTVQLKDEEYKEVKSILKKHLPETEIWVFGSRHKGTAQNYSDLDLAIKSDKPTPLGVLSALEEDFAESDLPFKVDLIDWNRISPEFRAHIEANHENF